VQAAIKKQFSKIALTDIGTEMSTYTVLSSSGNTLKLKRNSSGLRKIMLEVGNVPGRTILTYAYPIPTMSKQDPTKIQLYELPTYTIKVSGIDNTGAAVSQVWEVYRFGIYHNDGSDFHYKARGLFVAGLANEQTHLIKHFDPNYTVHSASSLENGAWQVKNSFLIHDGPDIPLTATNNSISGLYASVGCIEICGTNAGFDRFNKFIVELSGTKKTGTDALIEIASKQLVSIHYLEAKKPSLKEFVK
jgi:hypothetical protein